MSEARWLRHEYGTRGVLVSVGRAVYRVRCECPWWRRAWYLVRGR